MDLADRLIGGFLALPVEPPQSPAHFGLSFQDFYDSEILMLHQRAEDLREHKHAIDVAFEIPLDVVGLCPFPLAVACALLPATGSAPEMLFSFFGTMVGWVCHKEVHARFNPARQDRRTRPRMQTQGVANSGSNKSPFWRPFVTAWFVGADGEQSVFQTHAELFTNACKKEFTSRKQPILNLLSECWKQMATLSGPHQSAGCFWTQRML